MYPLIRRNFVAGLVISVAAIGLLTPISQPFAAKVVVTSLIEDGLDKAMRLRAGKDAIDCGRISSHDRSDTTDKCVTTAHRKKKPFVARYDLQGIDSIVADGLAGNTEGVIYVFRYDSDPSGGANIGESIQEEQCIGIKIIKNKRGRQIKCEK